MSTPPSVASAPASPTAATSAAVRWTIAAWALVLIVLGLVALEGIQRARLADWGFNLIRLERTFAWRDGVPLYSPDDSGVMLEGLYPPGAAIAYAPALLGDGVTAALRIAQRLSALYVLGPPLLMLALWRRRVPGDSDGAATLPWTLLAAALLLALALDARPLEYIATTVHADGPALACLLLAVAAVLGLGGGAGARADGDPHRGGHLRAAGAAAATVLAGWTKQVAAPIVVVVLLLAARRAGAAGVRRQLLWMTVLGLPMLALTFVVFGPVRDLWLHLVVDPGNHPYNVTGAAMLTHGATLLFKDLASLLPTLAIGLLVLVQGASAATRGRVRALLLLAAAMLPLSVLGRLKFGGDVNALSYVALPLALAAALALRDAAVDGPPRTMRIARGALLLLPLVHLLAVVTLQDPDAIARAARPIDVDALPHERAARYIAAHAGTVYFPRMTLVHAAVEKRWYHQGDGIRDRIIAERPPTAAHIEAHLPARVRWILHREDGFGHQMRVMPFGQLVTENDPALPGFTRWRRLSADASPPSAAAPAAPDAPDDAARRAAPDRPAG